MSYETNRIGEFLNAFAQAAGLSELALTDEGGLFLSVDGAALTLRYFPSTDDRSQYNGALWNTYGNIGKRQQVGLFLYGNYSPVTWFRIYMNGGIDYTDMESRSMNMSNDGFSGRIFAGTQFTLPLDFRINADGGYFSPWIQLQGKGSPFYFAGLRVSKDFLEKGAKGAK